MIKSGSKTNLPKRLRFIASALGLLICVGCSETAESPTFLQPKADQKPNARLIDAQESVEVARGKVVIAGPKGYCIDRPSSRFLGDTAFVLLGACASLTGDEKQTLPRTVGILTASISKRGDAPSFDANAIEAMRSYFQSEAGKAALARDGNPSSVVVKGTEAQDGAFFVRVSDTSENTTSGVSDTYWRGLFVVNERLVTISAFDIEGAENSWDGSLGLVRSFHRRIKQESPNGAATEQQSTPSNGLLGFIRKKPL